MGLSRADWHYMDVPAWWAEQETGKWKQEQQDFLEKYANQNYAELSSLGISEDPKERALLNWQLEQLGMTPTQYRQAVEAQSVDEGNKGFTPGMKGGEVLTHPGSAVPGAQSDFFPKHTTEIGGVPLRTEPLMSDLSDPRWEYVAPVVVTSRKASLTGKYGWVPVGIITALSTWGASVAAAPAMAGASAGAGGAGAAGAGTAGAAGAGLAELSGVGAGTALAEAGGMGAAGAGAGLGGAGWMGAGEAALTPGSYGLEGSMAVGASHGLGAGETVAALGDITGPGASGNLAGSFYPTTYNPITGAEIGTAGAGGLGVGQSTPAQYTVSTTPETMPIPGEAATQPSVGAPQAASPSGVVEPTPPSTAAPEQSFLDKLGTRVKGGLRNSLINKVGGSAFEYINTPSQQPLGTSVLQSPIVRQPGAVYEPEQAMSKLASLPTQEPEQAAQPAQAPQVTTPTPESVTPLSPTGATIEQQEQELKGRYQVKTLEDYLRRKVAERERMRRARFVA